MDDRLPQPFRTAVWVFLLTVGITVLARQFFFNNPWRSDFLAALPAAIGVAFGLGARQWYIAND